MKIEHWNYDGALITLDTDEVWADTFALWDCLVPTDTASAIATAVVAELYKLGEKD